VVTRSGQSLTFGTSSLIEVSKLYGGSETNVEPAFEVLKKWLPNVEPPRCSFAAAISIVLLLSVLTVVVVFKRARPAQPRLCPCLGGRALRSSPTTSSSAG
jgi:hypothetical protein